MGNLYHLNPGIYFLGDPALVMQKKGKAIEFANLLWDLVYADKIRFKEMKINGITLYVMKTKQGDGTFDGIGTDSGVIILMHRDSLSDPEYFKIPSLEKGFKWLNLDKLSFVKEEEGLLVFENGLKIDTNG